MLRLHIRTILVKNVLNVEPMAKNFHEVRDPIHVFVRLDTDERKILDSRPFQRLRHIHQLALSYLVYPGATHKRFEHSLGVMELAGRVFETVTHGSALTDTVKKLIPELEQPDKLSYWRRVLRMAALCHDIGHLPFSHAAEKELLPEGWDHERITMELILSEEMGAIWHESTPPLRPDHIVKLAVGRKAKDLTFSNWEAILSEIIVGDAFGVDRMDYLLRDSFHAGVAYGRFDHFRLIDTLRILPSPGVENDSGEPALGIEQGGLETAEALLLARYFMYTQVYFHPVRRIYDIHLKDFLKAWLPSNRFGTSTEEHLGLTDAEVTAAIRNAARDRDSMGHDPAQRIINRKHYRELYRRHPNDVSINPEAAVAVYKAAVEKFGDERVRFDQYKPREAASPDFPVSSRDGSVVSSLLMSEVLQRLPAATTEYVFVAPEYLKEAQAWLNENKDKIIEPRKENS